MPVAPSTPGRVLLLSFISVAHRRVVVRRCAVVPCSAIVLLRAFAFCRAVRNRARLLFRAVPSVVRRVVMSRCAVVVSRRDTMCCRILPVFSGREVVRRGAKARRDGRAAAKADSRGAQKHRGNWYLGCHRASCTSAFVAWCMCRAERAKIRFLFVCHMLSGRVDGWVWWVRGWVGGLVSAVFTT